MARDNLARLVRDLVLGDPVRKLEELLDGVVSVQLQHITRASYHRRMAEHYAERISEINPHEDWWKFARARQAQFDHEQSAILEGERAQQLGARISELDAKLREANL